MIQSPITLSKSITELLDYGVCRRTQFSMASISACCFHFKYSKITEREIKSFDALIDTAGNKLLSTQASFKSLCVLVIDVIFKSQCQLSLPLTIPYVDLSAV